MFCGRVSDLDGTSQEFYGAEDGKPTAQIP
jgi:hypothetical protein